MRKTCATCIHSDEASTSRSCAPCVGEPNLPNYKQIKDMGYPAVMQRDFISPVHELVARDIVKMCGTCCHFHLRGDEEPCKSCGGLLTLPYWKKK